ncbi:MAG: hypothetical protein ABEH78_03430 [Haloferacaceae archaeon]
MTGDTDPDPDWAERYLRYGLDPDEASVPSSVPPEAAEYMNDLSGGGPPSTAPEDRIAYLETAVRALVRALNGGDAPAERTHDGRSAVAFVTDDAIVVVVEGLGELIRVERATAPLIAFAYGLDPTDGG